MDLSGRPTGADRIRQRARRQRRDLRDERRRPWTAEPDAEPAGDERCLPGLLDKWGSGDDRHHPASPASPRRSRRPRRASEALIEEARQRARRRRRIYGAAATLVALVGRHGLRGLRAQRTVPDCFPALAARSSLSAGTTASKLAFIGTPRASPRAAAHFALYVMNADGSGKRRLTRDAFTAPPGRPTGRRSPSSAGRDGNGEVYVMNADGSGQRRLTRNPALDSAPAWSPDGRRIAFVSGRDGNAADLRHERRRERPAEADAQPGGTTALLPGRPTGGRSPSSSRPRRQLRDLRHERRRQRPAEPDAQRGGDDGILPGRPTGGRSPSQATATATRRSTS